MGGEAYFERRTRNEHYRRFSFESPAERKIEPIRVSYRLLSVDDEGCTFSNSELGSSLRCQLRVGDEAIDSLFSCEESGCRECRNIKQLPHRDIRCGVKRVSHAKSVS